MRICRTPPGTDCSAGPTLAWISLCRATVGRNASTSSAPCSDWWRACLPPSWPWSSFTKPTPGWRSPTPSEGPWRRERLLGSACCWCWCVSPGAASWASSLPRGRWSGFLTPATSLRQSRWRACVCVCAWLRSAERESEPVGPSDNVLGHAASLARCPAPFLQALPLLVHTTERHCLSPSSVHWCC